MSSMVFEDLLIEKDGLIKGPFGGDIKKALFVPKAEDTYKVYEQGVVINRNLDYGNYYISNDYFESKLKRFEVKAGDILMTGAGTLGELYVIPTNMPRGIINQALLRVRLNQEIIDADFFCYYFKFYIKTVISNINGDSVIPNLPPLSIIKCTKIDIPELSYQKKMASVLSSLDKKIELNNKIIKELEVMSKDLYDYWFVQFDFPDTNGNPYRSSGGKMVYNEKLKREIPEGWNILLIENWIESEKGGDWGKDILEGNYTLEVSCVRGADINGLNGNGICDLPTRYINKNNDDRILSVGDLVIEISGGSPTQSTGRIAVISDAAISRFAKPLICSNFCKAVTLKDKSLVYNFVYAWKKAYDNNILFRFEGKTSGIKNFLYEVFIDSYNVVEPPKELREKFTDIIIPIEEKKHKALKENEELAELRDWLLPMLMNGQVTISEAKSVSEIREIPVDAHILGGHIVNKLYGSKGWGRTKLQKSLHLVEYHCQLSLNSQSVRQTAGPFDQQMMNTLDLKFRQYGHVRKISIKESNGRIRYDYVPTAKITEIEYAFERYAIDKQKEIDSLLSKLRTMDLARAEIVSTLYAVWNNRIIKKQEITDKNLLTDFYDWSSHKSSFDKELVLKAINYMRAENIIPIGWGNYIDNMK